MPGVWGRRAKKAAGLGQTTAQPGATGLAPRRGSMSPRMATRHARMRAPQKQKAPRYRGSAFVPTRGRKPPRVRAKRPPSPVLRDLRRDGDRCRHEWRHGTQECVRHKSEKPRVIVVRLSSIRGVGNLRGSGQNDRPALRDGIACLPVMGGISAQHVPHAEERKRPVEGRAQDQRNLSPERGSKFGRQ